MSFMKGTLSLWSQDSQISGKKEILYVPSRRGPGDGIQKVAPSMPSRHEPEVILAGERRGPQGFPQGSSVHRIHEGKSGSLPAELGADGQ